MLMLRTRISCVFFFFNDTATTEIYTLSLHDALPISIGQRGVRRQMEGTGPCDPWRASRPHPGPDPIESTACPRSEEHTSELQSGLHLVCRLLLEKKKKKKRQNKTIECSQITPFDIMS